MPFDVTEFAWNSVDVRGDDGLLHNGRVVDAVEGGLVVDFGGTGHSGPWLIPFGCIYHRSYSYYMNEVQCSQGNVKLITEPKEAEVLLRLQPEDPWKWYPGRLLDGFGLVTVTMPDRELTGVVVEKRIRERSTEDVLAHLQIGKGRFSGKLVQVPYEIAASFQPDDQLVETFNARCRQRQYWIMATAVRNKVHQGIRKELVVLGMFGPGECLFYCGRQYYLGQNGPNALDWLQHHGIMRESHCCLDQMLLSVSEKSADSLKRVIVLAPETPCPEGDFLSLYRDRTIFPEIFGCLTTLQQSKLREVCSTWDTFLTSPYIRRVITLPQPFKGPDFEGDVYRFTSCLYNCWTNQTKLLVLCGESREYGCHTRFGGTVQVLQRIMTEKGLTAVATLLLTRHWHLRVYTANWVSALWESFVSLAKVCRQVVLKNVLVDIERFEETERFLSVKVRLPDYRMTRERSINNFWSMLNGGIRELDAKDVEKVAEWIGSCRHPSLRESIAQILNTTQALDPRDGVCYRGMSFNEHTQFKGVDVRHLTKLTLHSLLQRLPDWVDESRDYSHDWFFFDIL